MSGFEKKLFRIIRAQIKMKDTIAGGKEKNRLKTRHDALFHDLYSTAGNAIGCYAIINQGFVSSRLKQYY
jgi:hypothetical protein